MKRNSTHAFALIELVIVLAIIGILMFIVFPAFRLFQQQSSADQKAQEIVGLLRIAQSNTIGSKGLASYGVYFDISVAPHTYILFKGNTYATRDQSFDDIHLLPSSLELYNINIAGSQVVFDRLTGQTSQFGNISIRSVSDVSQSRTVYVESIGQIGLISPQSPSDASRVVDSRHVHAEYTGRIIDVATESVRLISGIVTQDIPIVTHMQAGQMYWQGIFLVSGQSQELTIQTHVLNDGSLHSQFSIHRDKRYNSQPLTIQLTGDASGNLIIYDINGQTTKGTSIYASTPVLQ